MRNRTHEVDVAKSVDILEKDNTELGAQRAPSVETLRDGAVMPKIKSSQQAARWSE